MTNTLDRKSMRRREGIQRRKIMKRRWQMYMFLLLPLAWLILFRYVPMAGIQIAFRKFTIRKGIWGSDWVGLYQFQKFLNSSQFQRVLVNTLRVSFYGLFAGFPLPIVLALCVNAMRSTKGKKFVQMVTYMPHFISTVVLVGMIMQLFNTHIGIYGILGRLINNETPNDLLGQSVTFPHMYVWSGIWQNMGWSSIIYIAALSNVDLELHEAAQIDGASRFQRVIYIDFPSIIPTATILLIMNAGSIMSVGFEKIYLMQNTLNLSTSEVISTYVYKVSLTAGGNQDFSYATAIDLFNAVINLLLLSVVNGISAKFGETSLW